MYEKPLEPIAAMYAWMIPHLQTVGKQYGYAIAVHGSMARDLDLVAVPWTDSASPAEVLVAAVCDAVGGAVRNDPQTEGNKYDATTRNPVEKSHGRLCWAIRFAGHRFYIDLSVMPLQQKGECDAQ